MIFKYDLSGKLKNTDRVITTYVSVPSGITQEQFLSRLESFKKVFEQVKVTVSYLA